MEESSVRLSNTAVQCLNAGIAGTKKAGLFSFGKNPVYSMYLSISSTQEIFVEPSIQYEFDYLIRLIVSLG